MVRAEQASFATEYVFKYYRSIPKRHLEVIDKKGDYEILENKYLCSLNGCISCNFSLSQTFYLFSHSTHKDYIFLKTNGIFMVAAEKRVTLCLLSL